MTTTNWAAVYLRVSTDDGWQTVENQRAEVEQLVRARTRTRRIRADGEGDAAPCPDARWK